MFKEKQLTPIDQKELPIIHQVKAWLENRHGKIAVFEHIPCPHEHRAYYPVAFVKFTNGDELVVKWETRPEKLRKEFAVGNLLLRHGIATAAPFELSVEPVALTMERLHGATLQESEVTTTTVEEVGRLLAEIHAIPVIEAEGVGIPSWEGATFQEEVQRKFTERSQDTFTYLPADLTADRVQVGLGELLRQSNWKGRRVLCRRDAHAENWFRLDNGSLAAIDHGNASIGDVSYDLTHLTNELKRDPNLISAFRSGYGTEQFDQATTPELQAISNLVHGLGIVGWVHKRGVPQPRFEAEGIEFIRKALQVVEGTAEKVGMQ